MASIVVTFSQSKLSLLLSFFLSSQNHCLDLSGALEGMLPLFSKRLACLPCELQFSVFLSFLVMLSMRFLLADFSSFPIVHGGPSGSVVIEVPFFFSLAWFACVFCAD